MRMHADASSPSLSRSFSGVGVGVGNGRRGTQACSRIARARSRDLRAYQ
jgi:hypothetical protein